MQAANELYDKNPFELSQGRTRMFDIVCGTDYVRKHFGETLTVDQILEYWMYKDTDDFKALSKKYYLY
jgi:hypothetical protein